MSTNQTPLRIFVLEDDADTRECLRMHFERSGHAVVTAPSLSSATKEMRQGDFDVLLSDIGLSDGLGWDFMESLHFARPIFAIAMSGLGSEEDVLRSKSVGFEHHLTKPVNLELLDSFLVEAAINLRSRVAAKVVIE